MRRGQQHQSGSQAHGGELGHLDFLQVLCQDEITLRETVAFQRRLQQAKFGQQITLEEFDFTASSKLPAAQIRDLGALRWLHAGESVIVFGPVGVGKTHIAQALGHLVLRQGAHVRFAKTSGVLADLAGGLADRTWENRIRELVRPDVLILADFAMRQLSAAQPDDFYELVSERQGRSLIITRDRAPSDWYPLFPNPVVAEFLLDRLINTSHQVIMNGPSYRPNKRTEEPHRQDQVGKTGGRRGDTAVTAVTQQFARIPAEYLDSCRQSAEASPDGDPHWDPPSADVLDLDWAPFSFELACELGGLDDVQRNALRQTLGGDTAIDLAFLNTHPHAIGPFRSDPTALSAAQEACRRGTARADRLSGSPGRPTLAASV
ncbi:ATP-binding protein [Streptomyces sp. NPDC091377]|uniref:ATP-binding protein n=1 Tax=Streptomyces sp. NPDC091377 TaxID=3365995 RepID=UPI0038091A64